VAYGRGTFWTKTDIKRFKLLRSDLRAVSKEQRHDFRNLPYENGTLDTVVLDPPYVHDGGTNLTARQYRNGTTTGNHRALIELYKQGMSEAVRTLKPGGQLWIKCKDEIESGSQRWSHIEIYNLAISLGMFARDLFVLIPASQTSTRWENQYHARKNHSFLWIMERPRRDCTARRFDSRAEQP
jgi:hypothetical protein